ncbi:MAG: hypothetical protein HYR62_02890 [Actinobacteria bacterium]|nr:hypothetical protein [Actinomycetota bacterium]MBI3687416.1 hypothetical protein [Actinomycetota bacterium]
MSVEPALTFDPVATQAWLREPTPTPTVTRAERFGATARNFGSHTVTYLATPNTIVATQPDGWHPHGIVGVRLWSGPPGSPLWERGAVLTVALANNLSLASTRESVKRARRCPPAGDRRAPFGPGAHQPPGPAPDARLPDRPPHHPDRRSPHAGDRHTGRATVPRLFTEAHVNDALNRVADDLLQAVDAAEVGLRDAIHLTVNATTAYHTGDAQTLGEVVEQRYDSTDNPTALSWLTGQLR